MIYAFMQSIFYTQQTNFRTSADHMKSKDALYHVNTATCSHSLPTKGKGLAYRLSVPDKEDSYPKKKGVLIWC